MDPAPTFRVFVSSPGDAQFERQRVDRVVARLNGELSGSAQLATVRWETDFYQAHSTFQAQIPLSTECSIVVAIFRARLGTELPPEFEHQPDGDPYPSGTAYEVLTAIAKRQHGADLPDVFVFRCSEPPRVSLEDSQVEAEARSQWARLKSFFARWFLTDQGQFKAAFQTFATTDDFEAQFERLLRDWLRQRLSRDGITAWPIATKGSPFPGLSSFGPRHAPVFFGRSRDTAQGVEAWAEAAGSGTPFLLVVGASGSGKSSLARAGLVPRLTTPGVVPNVDVWRVAAMRPGQTAGGPVASLAHALLEATADLPASEEGRLPALPEIAEGDYRTPEDLASLLSHADRTAIRPVVGALDKVGEQERQAHGYERAVRADLVLLVDQLDELFAGAVPAVERARFGTLLAALAATGRVWIVATLRADLYELFLRDETLFGLKSAGATLDLAPPVLSDMAEAIRGPARAAGLAWDLDPATREPLDARLIRDIDRPDLLPIVQFTLDRLFQEREVRDGKPVLTFAAYQALGTLDGAIETAAEAAIAPLGPAAGAALPRVLRALVSFTAAASGTGGASPALRQAPRALVAHDPDAERLVSALIDARILISGRDPADIPVVALAHQRVIEAWPRAREAIAQSAEVLRVREAIEVARQRWEGEGRRNDLLLAPGLVLHEAEHSVIALKGELSSETIGFVERSGRAARLRFRLVAAAAVVFLFLAIGAGALGFVARQQQVKAEAATAEAMEQSRQAEAARQQAEQQRQEAEAQKRLAEQQRQQAVQQRQAADLARQQAEAARQQAEAARRQAEAARQQADQRLLVAQQRLAAADEFLNIGDAEKLRLCLASTARVSAQPAPAGSREFFAKRWHVDQGTTSTDVDWKIDGSCESKGMFGGGARAIDTTENVCSWTYDALPNQEFLITYRATKLDDQFPKKLRFRIVNPTRIRNVDYNYDAFRIVCPAEEITIERDRMAPLQWQAEHEPSNLEVQHSLAAAIEQLADILYAQGEFEAAITELNRSQQIRLKLAIADDANPDWKREFGLGFMRIGNVHEQLQRFEDALDDYEHAMRISRELLARYPAVRLVQRDLAGAASRVASQLVRLKRDRPRSLALYREAIGFQREVARAFPNDAQLAVELMVVLNDFSLIAEPAEQKAALQEALAIAQRLEAEQKLPSELSAWPSMIRGRLAEAR